MRLTQVDISRLLGVSPSNVKQFLQTGKMEKDSGGKINITASELNSSFLLERGIIARNVIKTPNGFEQKQDESDDATVEISGLPEKYLNMTIRELIMKHGDLKSLKSYVDVLQKLLASQKIDLDNQIKRGDLLPRKFFEFLKGYIDTFNNHLFDYAESCVVEFIPLIRSDETLARVKIPEMMKKNFQKYADETIKNMRRELKKADSERGQKAAKDDDTDDE